MVHKLKPKRALRFATAARIAALTIPLILILLFLVMRGDPARADWAERAVAAPLRGFLAKLTSLGPLRYISVSEILIAACVVWIVAALAALIVALIRRTARVRAVLRHVAVMAAVAAWIAAMFSWTWGIGYGGQNLAQKTGLISDGITVEDLAKVTALFAGKASEYSRKVPRMKTGACAFPCATSSTSRPPCTTGLSRSLPYWTPPPTPRSRCSFPKS